MSKAPPLVSPMKATPAFSFNLFAWVRSVPAAVRSALTRATSAPSSLNPENPAPNPSIDTRTAAPSSTQGSSAQASRSAPAAAIGSSTRRLAPPRIELVVTSPARRPASASPTARHAFSTQ